MNGKWIVRGDQQHVDKMHAIDGGYLDGGLFARFSSKQDG